MQGAVEQRRREHRGAVEAGADLGVDGVGGDPGGPVHGQPAAQHVVAVRREAVAAAEPRADQVGRRGSEVVGRAEQVRGDPGDGGVDDPADPERVAVEVQHPVADRGGRGGQPAETGGGDPQRAGHRGGGGGEHAQGPAVEVEVERVRAAVDDLEGSVGAGGEPVTDPDRCRGGHGGRGSGGHASRR